MLPEIFTASSSRAASTELEQVFKLSPNNGNWTYTDLHDFTIVNGGAFPDGSGDALRAWKSVRDDQPGRHA